ncbi:glycoside hydrolase family protein [Devosia sp. ZB163]|uniref:glycoside hydrolase family protein n=1 Tax=Devosia sp. ZB163 TaxID=3025938 RepID=UPI00235F14E4|nr:glycoside hydrolase family protein [Devosia sp. ZB163]MDC9824805.1 glycoside hydrolase family protein [Devosia sp. ZB163]
MAINKAGLELIKHFEGLRLEAYLDPVDIWTIGWGHTGGDVYEGLRITVDQAEKLLKDDLKKHENFVDAKVTATLTENQRAALVSFAFNVGNGNFGSSTLLRKLNANDVAGAADELLRWVYGTTPDGERVRLPGLERRRKAERELFLSQPVELESIRMEVSPSAEPEVVVSEVQFNGGPIPMSLLGGHKDLVLSVQDALTGLGYLDPPSDGKFGDVTRWALDEFCRMNGLSTSDGFTAEIAAALRAPRRKLPEVARTGGWFDRVVDYMQAQRYFICRHSDCQNIVYVEGMDADGKSNDDKPNVFNDLRIVFSVDPHGVPQLTTWEGTTEPGTFWTVNPMNPGGAARIAFNQYKAWRVGTHLPGKPSASHEALVQVEPVTVHRDLNKDYQRIDDRLDVGLFGINQHWGYNAPKDDLGQTSAGCLVGRTKDGHREFMALVKTDARYKANPGYKFVTTVLPGDKVLA